MKRIPGEECASICGLFCGACPAFPEDCHGCLSDFVRDSCKNCSKHGFLECAAGHNVTRCYECGKFPCDKLKEFSTKPVIKGICNHENVIADSLRMKEAGISRWVDEKISEHKCPKCGELKNWFEMTSHTCDKATAEIATECGETSERDFFLETDRIGFSKWKTDDITLATLLWGDPEVTGLICASGRFSAEDIANRLQTEVKHDAEHHVQYWPVFHRASKELIGCCGLRPYDGGKFEIGFHLRPKFWGQGYATEAARAVISYAFSELKAEGLFAGHNPNNTASSKVLLKLGFRYIGDEFYPPTGLYHPSYEMKPSDS